MYVSDFVVVLLSNKMLILIGGEVVITAASEQDGFGFESQETFLCGVCMFYTDTSQPKTCNWVTGEWATPNWPSV